MRITAVALAVLVFGVARLAAAELDLVAIPAGTVVMGDAEGEADETPREVRLGAFRIMRREVTNAGFAAFAEASGRRTAPERSGRAWVWRRKWRLVDGADWRHPFGPETTIAGKDGHPVVQISARDAQAFCAFHGLRLPTEAEWERAARGTAWRRYPWGDEAPGEGGRASFGAVACCAARAAAIADRSRGLPSGSGPPRRAETVNSRTSFVKIFPRLASWRPLRC